MLISIILKILMFCEGFLNKGNRSLSSKGNHLMKGFRKELWFNIKERHQADNVEEDGYCFYRR